MNDDYESICIESARQGQEKAWETLFESHYRPIYVYCLQMVHGRESYAEDLAQETFVTAARRISCFNPQKGSFRQWLLGIARKRSMKLQVLEKRKKLRLVELENNSRIQSFPDNSDLIAIHEIIAQLPPKYRLVLELKYVYKFTLKEISEQLSTSISAVESRIRRARSRFISTYTNDAK